MHWNTTWQLAPWRNPKQYNPNLHKTTQDKHGLLWLATPRGAILVCPGDWILENPTEVLSPHEYQPHKPKNLAQLLDYTQSSPANK